MDERLWKLTDVEDAKPVIVCVAINTCFRSITVESLLETVTVSVETAKTVLETVKSELETAKTELETAKTAVKTAKIKTWNYLKIC